MLGPDDIALIGFHSNLDVKPADNPLFQTQSPKNSMTLGPNCFPVMMRSVLRADNKNDVALYIQAPRNYSIDIMQINKYEMVKTILTVGEDSDVWFDGKGLIGREFFLSAVSSLERERRKDETSIVLKIGDDWCVVQNQQTCHTKPLGAVVGRFDERKHAEDLQRHIKDIK